MSVIINETNFPYESFRNYVSQYYDLDGDGVLSDEEIAEAKTFSADYFDHVSSSTKYKWQDVRGLEFFTELETIELNGQHLYDFNFSGFKKLKKLSMLSVVVAPNESVDLRSCTSLKELSFGADIFRVLYLSPSLEDVSITQAWSFAEKYYPEQYHNFSITVDFSVCSNIRSINLNKFHIPTTSGSSVDTLSLNLLGLSNRPALQSFSIMNSEVLETLDLSGNTELTEVTVRNCDDLKTLDLSGCSKLLTLGSSGCDNLLTLNISGCTNLETLECTGNNLRPSLDLSEHEKLKTVKLYDTSLSSLILGNKPDLKVLQCFTSTQKIAIRSLDLNGCIWLSHMLVAGEYTYETYYKWYGAIRGQISTTGMSPYDADLAYDSRTTIENVNVKAVAGHVGVFYVDFNYTSEGESHGDQYRWQFPGRPLIYTNICRLEMNADDLPEDGTVFRCDCLNWTSLNFELDVIHPPEILIQPDSVISAANQEVIFSIDADDPENGELFYQWERSNDNGVNWATDLDNSDSSSYRLTAIPSDDGALFRCRLTSSSLPELDDSVLSENALLSIVSAPTITENPASAVLATGNLFNISVSATDRYLSYQWQVSSDNGESWTDIPDATEDSYSFTTARADSGKQYKCVVTNAAGTVESDPATLTVYDPPVIVSRSTIQECIAEGTEVTLSVTASGDNLQYKWQVNQNGEWTDIENATDQSYTFTAVREDTEKRFQCYIYNTVGNVTCEIYDDPEHSAAGATPITVVYQPSITDQTIASPVQTGNEAVFTVSAEGGRLSYQWQVSSDNGENWVDIDGAVTNPYSFTVTKADSGKQYRCHATNLAGNADSLSERLTVLDPPVINSSLSVPLVADGASVTLPSDASGDDLNYQWQSSSDNAVWTDIPDASEETYTFTADASQNHTFYRYRVWNSVNEAVSNAAELVVVTKPNATTSPESQILAVGTQATLAVSASGEALDYQWQVSFDNGENWTNIPGATTDIYTFTAEKADSGKQYRCHVENIAGEAVSEAASLTVLFSPVVLTSPDVDEFVSEGTSVTLEVNASGDELSHKWYVKYGDVDQWYPIEVSGDSQYTDLTVSEQTAYLEDGAWHSGEKSVSLTFTAARELSGNQYRCEFSNDVGSALSDATNALVVLFQPRIKQIISPANAVRNGDPVSLSVIAEGGNLSYRWTVSTDNGESWENIADSGNDSTYSFIATVSQNDYLYACTVTNLAGSYTSDPISFVVQIPPSVSQSPASAVVGNSATATFHATFDGTQLHYQWQASSDNGATWIELEDTDSDTYSFTASIEKDGHLYRCRATNNLGFVTTGSALLTVLTYPAIVTHPSSSSVDYASNVVFLVSATGGNLFYQWQYSSDNGVTWKNVTKNGTNATYSFLAADTQNGYQYRCLVANNLGSVTSNAATLTVIGSATSEDETADQVYPGKYLPSQMANMIRNLPVGVDLDNIRFGNKTPESLHANVGSQGSTDPENYEKIAKAINELKLLIRQMQG